MRPAVRILSSAVACLVALSIGDAAFGDNATSTTRSTAQTATSAKKRVKNTRPKKAARPARGTSRLSFATQADSPPAEVAIIEAELPPVGRGRCPSGMVSIEQRYCIDKYEASLVEKTLNGERPFSPYEVVDGHDVRAVSVPGVYPQGYISGAQAQDACRQSKKRLCKAMEWRKACVGPSGNVYGYSDKRERGKCNDAGRSPMVAIWHLGGVSDPGAWDPLKMNDPRNNQVPGSLARTGSHPSCTNAYGVVDMVGNLHEWVDDPSGTFQGGYYLDTSINGEGCGYRTSAHDFAYHDYSTGFRCCSDLQE